MILSAFSMTPNASLIGLGALLLGACALSDTSGASASELQDEGSTERAPAKPAGDSATTSISPPPAISQQSKSNPERALGKPFEDPAVQALVGDAYKNCFVDGAGHFQCPLSGVTLVINVIDDRITVKGMILYPNASGSMAPYLGPLPGGLTRDLNADGVHAKLGEPSASGNNWETYGNHTPSILVDYFPLTNPDNPGVIARVQI